MKGQVAVQLINAAFSVIATIRRMGMATEEINERLDRVDNGGVAITIEEVREGQTDWQTAIDEGRAL